MNSLLHSLRGFKTTVPFTFDEDKMGFDVSKWMEIEVPTPTPIGSLIFQVTVGEASDGSEKGYRKGEFGDIDYKYISLADPPYEIAAFVVSSSKVAFELVSPYTGETLQYEYEIQTSAANFSGETDVADGSTEVLFMQGFEASIVTGNVSAGDVITVILREPEPVDEPILIDPRPWNANFDFNTDYSMRYYFPKSDQYYMDIRTNPEAASFDGQTMYFEGGQDHVYDTTWRYNAEQTPSSDPEYATSFTAQVLIDGSSYVGPMTVNSKNELKNAVLRFRDIPYEYITLTDANDLLRMRESSYVIQDPVGIYASTQDARTFVNNNTIDT